MPAFSSTAFLTSDFTQKSPCDFMALKIEAFCSFMRCLAFTCYFHE